MMNHREKETSERKEFHWWLGLNLTLTWSGTQLPMNETKTYNKEPEAQKVIAGGISPSECSVETSSMIPLWRNLFKLSQAIK